ncbi:MAG TPA: hypothetical protein VFE50_01270 [Cyclobacteriaceae bacterium]|nr:hypothetical protein [Cyclobacteriaceae bacterium]
MKTLILIVLGVFFTLDLTAQVIFRNDFIIGGRERRIENVGITHITVNLGRFPNWNQLFNGRGGRTLVIDVRALRGQKTSYTYTEIAEKIYMPAIYTGQVTQKVPFFLLLPPPNANLIFEFKPKFAFTKLR